MRTPLIFLKIVGKAALDAAGIGGLWSILAEELPQLANNVWDDWHKARTRDQRRDDLEAVALLREDVALDVEAILAEIAPDKPVAIREELAEYLTQIPISVRQTLRRPEDPAGHSVPPTREPRSGQDLIPFLSAQRPRFRRGQRPILDLDWELVELLGIGGCGEVWKAKHAWIEDFEPVALKFCTDPKARERLLRHEAKLCARVQKEGKHPGIVILRNAHLTANPPCLEYEYIAGGTLAGLVKEQARTERKPTVEEVTRQLLAIAEIVAYAHRLDPPIVHRDLKPANILIQGVGASARFKIADFGIGGIATASAIRATREATHPSILLTMSIRGSHTPIYASPEQAAGGDPDPRDDVHALGVIWLQMLTGDLTTGRPGGRAWKKRLDERGMAAGLIDLLESCFEEASERVADAAILCERIKSGPSPATTMTAPSPPSREEPPRERLPVEAPPTADSPQIRIGESIRFDGHKGQVRSVAFAPDNRRALSGSRDGTVRLWGLPV